MKNIDISRAEVPKESLQAVIKNIGYNKVILDYYSQMMCEVRLGELKKFKNKFEKIKECNRYWEFDRYEIQKVKDFQRTNLCMDKFCANCKKVKQAARKKQYEPELEKYKDQLYHMVLTVPNVQGLDLQDTIKHMAKCFKSLTRYLTGNLKIKGIDFSTWGYKGAVRSLEVTIRGGDEYHPHYHTGLVMDKPLSRKVIQNKYSFDYRNGLPELKRLFSEEEVLIQKIWRLLYDGEKVTKKAIEELEIGYSCMIVQFAKSDYAELFKYMTKEVSESGDVFTYDQFRTLYNALLRVKQIQGYGLLYRITDDIDTEAFEAEYEAIIQSLREKENPVFGRQTPQDLLSDQRYTLISRKSYSKSLRQLYHEQMSDSNGGL